MYKYIWLVPLLPLAGAAINGIFGRWFSFPEKLVGGIAVGSVALSFLISVAAIYSYGFGGNALWPNPYVTSGFIWIPGGAVNINLGSQARGLIAADKEVQKKLAEMTPEQRARPQSILVAAIDSPRSSLLNVEWSYQLDSLSSIFPTSIIHLPRVSLEPATLFLVVIRIDPCAHSGTHCPRFPG